MSRNLKISEIEEIRVSPNEETQVLTYNFTTKKLASMPLGTFQRSFGLDDAKFFVGNHSGQDPDEKFCVFGDAKINGNLVAPSGVIGSGVSPSGGGFTIGSKFYAESIFDTGSLNPSEIRLSNSEIRLITDSKESMLINSSGITFNPNKESDILLKGYAYDDHNAFDTAFAFDMNNGRLGVGTDNPLADLDVYGGRVIIGGKHGAELNKTQIIDSFAAFASKATGHKSVSIGDSSSYGDLSFSVGSSIASGLGSFSQGSGSEAIGDHSVAMNSNTKSEGFGSMSIGSSTKSIGDFSFSAGTSGESLGLSSFSAGLRSKAAGDYSFSIGQDCIGSGVNSVVMGTNSSTSGDSSKSFGVGCETVGNRSTSMGKNTKVIGSDSFANGVNCEVIGSGSFSEGVGSKALADNSMAIGIGALAAQEGEHNRSMIPDSENAHSSISKFFLRLEQDGFQLLQKYDMTLANGSNSIVLEDGSYTFSALINGIGVLKETEKFGSRVTWGYKINGHISVTEDSGIVQTPLNVEPYVYYTPMSPLYGTPISNDPTVDETYIITDDEIVISPNQYNQIIGYTPYVEFDKSTKSLKVGVSRNRNASFVEIHSARIGNMSAYSVYYMQPSVLIKGKDLITSPLGYDDIEAVFLKDENYMKNTYGWDWDSSVHSNVNDSGDAPLLNYEGVGEMGSTDVPYDEQVNRHGYDSLDYAEVSNDTFGIWSSCVEINKLNSL